jgi:hypothetical protein
MVELLKKKRKRIAKYWPADLELDKQMKRGDFDCMLSSSGVSIVKWIDN